MKLYDELLAEKIEANGGIHDILWLNHSDSVSGMTFFDDGSVIYWSEESMVGESPVIMVDGFPQGGERVGMDLQSMKGFGYDYAIKCFTDGPSESAEIRPMTLEEEEKWSAVFNGPVDE